MRPFFIQKWVEDKSLDNQKISIMRKILAVGKKAVPLWYGWDFQAAKIASSMLPALVFIT